jgi:hypothetical protein
VEQGIKWIKTHGNSCVFPLNLPFCTDFPCKIDKKIPTL